MNGIDPTACKFALTQIKDGFIFEEFSHSFLSAILGHSFLHAGGIKDRGIDGLENLFTKEGNERVIYQYSIEKDPEQKAARTLELLKANKIKFDQFTYVSNQEIHYKDKFLESLSETYKKPVQLYDLNWFAFNVNQNPAALSAYNVFIKSYLHEFQKPGACFDIGDLVSDPRLYVFLRQQWESTKSEQKLDEVLADTLILYALEGTDPDIGILKSRDEIILSIEKHLKFEPKLLMAQIESRLSILSSKPNRKIKLHTSEDAYCLSFEARQELTQKNFKDAALYQGFRDDVTLMLKRYLKTEGVRVQDCIALIDGTLHKLFYKQGLEFSDLVSTGYSKDAFEKSLPETIAEVVDESRVTITNRQLVKQALLLTIRNIIYNGNSHQKEYLQCLANTYMLLFLLQCDPKISMFFANMAGRLNVYVCTSILIPALSEICLDGPNRRYWNLLVGARNAGVKLKINELILNELAAHFRMIRNIFKEEFDGNEELYDDELTIIYIKQILIRAYFYSKLRGQIENFNAFLDKFCSPDLQSLEQDLIYWLKDSFGIEFVAQKNTGAEINQEELNSLETALIAQGKDKPKAKTDAKLVLTIFSLREKNKEKNPDQWSGYNTWWLSSDKLTQRIVNNVFGSKYSISCYMRPDFLYNYISLAPTTGVVTEVFQHVFPNLLGVNISHNLPPDVTNTVRQFIKDHQDKEKPRMKSILCTLSDRLKSDPQYGSRAKVVHFLDEQKHLLEQAGA